MVQIEDQSSSTCITKSLTLFQVSNNKSRGALGMTFMSCPTWPHLQVFITLFIGSDSIIRRHLEQAANKGCSDDRGSLRENGLKYIPKVPGHPTLDLNAKKEMRGFNHIPTGRLLCPRFRLGVFDDDPNAFCHGVLNGTRMITHDSDDWPT